MLRETNSIKTLFESRISGCRFAFCKMYLGFPKAKYMKCEINADLNIY